MSYRHALVAAAALSNMANAAPVAASGGFSVSQSATGRMIPKSGAVAYQQALSKYHAEIPDHVHSAVIDAQSGSAPANPTEYDSEYLVSITVGSSTLPMDFDTGSSDLWVFSDQTPSSDETGQATYDTSTGTLESGESWSITYGDGSGAAGIVYADTVDIGGVTVTSQAIEAATSVSGSFTSDSASSGLVGLAFSSINTVSPDQQQVFWANAAQQGLAQDVFCADLKYEAPGSYDFGLIDSSKYSGEITYTPVDNSQGFWGFTADGYSVGGSSTTESLAAIADTGTSLILIADDVVSAYYGSFGGTNSQQYGGYVFDCSTTAPDFGLIVGGNTFTVPGEYLNYAPNGDGTCYGGIQSSSGVGFNIMGDVFLKSQYVIFDFGNTQLGLASQ